MNVNIQDLPESVLASYEETARARGIPLDAFLRESLIQHAPAPFPLQMSPEDWDKALDDCFDSFALAASLPDEALTRESIYGREDSW